MATTAARLFRNRAGTVKSLALLQKRDASIQCKKLEFSKYGDPLKVITKVEEKLDGNVKGKEVLVEMLAAPLNPADINTVQGTYAVKPDSFPAVIGNEGVGRVLAVGPDTDQLEVGDMVIPFLNQLGTCRSHGHFLPENLIKIRSTVPLVEAATLSVNPCTAFRMLHDFVQLEDEEVVIQNGANSAVGQAVIQLCRLFGYRSVNVVRDRDNIGELKEYLSKLGATVVLTEEELRTTKLFASGQVPRPRLGLNCVGGASATELVRHLEHQATLVTYGGMSRLPLTLPVAQLIFKDLRVRAFWMTRWTNTHQLARARWEMLDQLQSLAEQKYFTCPKHRLVHIDQWRDAVAATMPREGKADAKQILVFDRKLLA